MTQYNTIAELQNFIVLDNYTKSSMVNEPPAGYQTEAALEHAFSNGIPFRFFLVVLPVRSEKKQDLSDLLL